ncbi:MAG TPA: FAD-binding oxidoreductase [Candidatus Saccharimonadales bacterium]|nr:FAD-binding oxidoreductase [Candidatus Saccharimonadales bacterium]
MDSVKQKLATDGFKGEIDDSASSIEAYSHDASLFELRPKLIVSPKDKSDVELLIRLASDLKKSMPEISLTARSAGTDMSGGAINDSIIVDFLKHFTKIEDTTANSAHAQPGVYYRDFETATLKHNALMPSYPASRDLCTIGGMVNNNAGGEKSLEYGKTENFVSELSFVFADGVERIVKPLSRTELNKKMTQKDFEGQVYSQLFKLVESNYEAIKAAKPHVTKNSTGYNLWDVWDKEKDVFDLTKLIVGAQGTLGFVTDIHFRLVPKRPYSGLLVCFLRTLDPLAGIINEVLEHKPATFESFDDNTLYLAIKFLPSFRKFIGDWGLVKLMVSLIPDGLMLLHGIPKLILMIEFNEDSQELVDEKIKAMHKDLKATSKKIHPRRKNIKMYRMAMEEDNTIAKSNKFWIMRRQSFNLLRSKVKDKHTAPFIDDLVVNPPYLTDFLPKLRKIIKKYNLLATIAGHLGDGNFHIIPLMKLEEPAERAKLLPAMKEVNELVLSFHGSLSGEHNDGLVRGPWLEEMYGKNIVKIFREAKSIMDPLEIFNPHKKANATKDYSYSHVRDHF